MMKLFVGLGNPGNKYQKTRHNLGFLVLEKLRKDLEFPVFKENKKFKASISQGKISNKKIILAQPLTFVNESGQAVTQLAKFYKIKPNDIVIIRDDIDLEMGKIREKKQSGSGGHKGIESIIKTLKSKNFTQIKIGIRTSLLDKMDPAKFVLKKFTKTEEQEIKKIVNRVAKSIKLS